MKYLIILFIPVLLFCAIAGSHIGKGFEYSQKSKADDRAAWQAQQRDQQAALNELRLQQEQAILPYKIQAKQNAIFWISLVSIVTACIVIPLVGIGVSRAIVKRANLWTIGLDSTTRQYPLLTYELNGVVRVANPNTGQILRLDKERRPVTQLVLNAGSVQLAGVESNHPLVIEGATK